MVGYVSRILDALDFFGSDGSEHRRMNPIGFLKNILNAANKQINKQRAIK